jgi:hypothetical protein
MLGARCTQDTDGGEGKKVQVVVEVQVQVVVEVQVQVVVEVEGREDVMQEK